MQKVYLAGPEVFLPNALELGRRKQALCRDYGFLGLFPFDNEVDADGPVPADRMIYTANRHMIEEADLGIFNLTPFRGVSADVGTVFELGMMAGLRKPIFGYTNVGTALIDRIAGVARGKDGRWRDPGGSTVEDFGNADNLMIDASLAESGAGLVRVDAAGRLDALDGFERCLRRAAEASSARLLHRHSAVL